LGERCYTRDYEEVVYHDASSNWEQECRAAAFDKLSFVSILVYFTLSLYFTTAKMFGPIAILASAVLLKQASAASCSVTSNIRTTFFGYPDNSPPGAAIAWDCGRGYTAGGTGTYADPLTFASDKTEFSVCQIVYSPYLKKYLRMEDDCAQCGASSLKRGFAEENC
jgi:hypothetical protein